MDIPASLRRWFLAHTVVDLLVGLPLLIAPGKFLGALHWPVVDPVSPRIVGAALLAIAVQSFTARNDGVESYRTNLNFKLLWSWSAITALVIAAADGAPDAVWAFLALFIAFSGVWFHYRVRLGQMDHADDLHEADSEPDAEMAAMLDDPKLAHGPSGISGDPDKVHPSRSFDKLGAEDIAAFAAEREKKAKAEADAAAERKAKEQAARAAAELAAWEASDDGTGDAGGETAAVSSTKTLQGRPRTREELDDELTGAAGESDEATADRLAADDIAAMLAANQGNDEPAPTATEEAAGADDIAAMLAAQTAEPTIDDDQPANKVPAPQKKPITDSDADLAAVDDIAAMLATNQDDDDQGSAADIAAMLAAQTGESTDAEPPATPPAEDDAGADDIAAMLAANQTETEAPPAAAPADAEAGSEDIAAMLAANRAVDVAATPPTLDVDLTEEEVTRPGTQASDFAHLAALADEPPAPRPARSPVDLAVPAPEDVVADEVANDDIAAMLAANRANEG